jgi:hypothetical protein
VFPAESAVHLEARNRALQRTRENNTAPIDPPATLDPNIPISELSIDDIPISTEEDLRREKIEMYQLYGVVAATWLTMVFLMMGLAYFAGARFDLAFAEVYSALKMLWNQESSENRTSASSGRVAGGAEQRSEL